MIIHVIRDEYMPRMCWEKDASARDLEPSERIFLSRPMTQNDFYQQSGQGAPDLVNAVGVHLSTDVSNHHQ